MREKRMMRKTPILIFEMKGPQYSGSEEEEKVVVDELDDMFVRFYLCWA